MIVVNIIGGLGNQLFQYAFGRGLAIRTGREVRYDTDDYLWYHRHDGLQLEHLGLDVRRPSEKELRALLGWRRYMWSRKLRITKRFPSRHTIIEPHYAFSEHCFAGRDNSYYIGNWQSPRYFSNADVEIRKQFADDRIGLSAYGDLVGQITGQESVAVHVRRGDFVSNPRDAKVHSACGLGYYERAAQQLRALVRNPVFFVFSDEPETAEREGLFAGHSVYVKPSAPVPAYTELKIMSMCKHFITANSTFGWWAAWLATNPQKRVITPSQWYRDGRSTRDLVPDQWLTADV